MLFARMLGHSNYSPNPFHWSPLDFSATQRQHLEHAVRISTATFARTVGIAASEWKYQDRFLT